MNALTKINFLRFVICTIIIVLSFTSCNLANKSPFHLLSNTLIGTWGIDKSAVTEIWQQRNADSIHATTYLFNDQGDSIYLSSSYIYKNNQKIYLDIISNNGKMKLYYLKSYEAPYFTFEAITREFYPTKIQYKLRENNSNYLESQVDGIVQGANKHYDFKMYKI